MALSGVAVSASFSAWGMLLIILLSYGLMYPSIILRNKMTVLAVLGLLILTSVIMWPYLQKRGKSVFTNPSDNSVNYRLRAALELILNPANNSLSAWLGTGVGLDSKNPQVENTFLQYFSKDYLEWSMGGRGQIVIVNGWTYITVTMGWIGLILNGWLLASIFRRGKRWSVPRLPLLLLSIGYLIGIGSYLSPPWWAWLTFAVGLRRGII